MNWGPFSHNLVEKKVSIIFKVIIISVRKDDGNRQLFKIRVWQAPSADSYALSYILPALVANSAPEMALRAPWENTQ